MQNSARLITILALFVISAACASGAAQAQPTPQKSAEAETLQPTPQAPAATETAAAPPIIFAVIGDFGIDSQAEADVAAQIGTWNADFVITTGDNRYTDITYDRAVGKHYCAFMTDVLSHTNCAGGDAAVNSFFPSTGNHDYSDGKGGGINEYIDYFTLPGSGIATTGTSGTELYYDFIQGPVHFFVVDSLAALDETNRQTQQAWLQNGLQNSTTPWQIVYFHHPPYSSASHGSNPFMQWPFADWGADAVLGGHDHTYERIGHDGIPYFVNGLGGNNIYNFIDIVDGSVVRYNSDYGAMRVTADEASIHYEFVTRTGNVIDSFTDTAKTATMFFPVIAGR